MEVSDEEFGGTLVTLRKGDSLKSIPRSHRQLITAEIEAWWADPMHAVRRIAEWAVTPNMEQWFGRMADARCWSLELHKAEHGETQAGFWLSCPGIRGAEVGPPPAKPSVGHLPDGLSDYHRLVGYVHWMVFGTAGGLAGPDGHKPLTEWPPYYHAKELDPTGTFVFGYGPGGDMLVYTAEGRAGWICHGNAKVHFLGTVRDALDWVYGELLADRCPDFDYNWA